MPKTKLCKGSNDSSDKTKTTAKATDKATSKVKATQPTDVQSDDLMADFELPDDLRKQLEYPANVKKRQLADEHRQKKLEAVNARLKASNTKVSVQCVGSSLVLQATLPLKPDEVSKDGSPNKQTKISLGIPFNVDGLKTAEEEARELGTLIARKTFVWNEKYLGKQAQKMEVVPTIGELLERFEERYFANRKRNRQSESTFSRHAEFIKRFTNLKNLLTKQTVTETVEKTISGSANRGRLVIALSVFCNTFDFKFDFKGCKKGYKPKQRKPPTDKEIEEKFYNFKPCKINLDNQYQAYQWVYGILATYGLRPHEVFAIDIEKFIDSTNTLHELRLDESLTDGTKTGERTIFPLHPHWVELFDLKNVKTLKTNANFRNKVGLVSENISKRTGFPAYNLRHAYAIRGHELGIPIKEMADNMGHGVDMHTRTYQKYMTMDTRRIVYQNAIDKANKIKTEKLARELMQTENELLKAENELLRTKIESLETMLAEYQMSNDMINQQ